MNSQSEHEIAVDTRRWSRSRFGGAGTILFLLCTALATPEGALAKAKVEAVSSSDAEIVLEISGARCGPAWPGCPTDLERIMPVAEDHCARFGKAARYSGKLDYSKPIYRVECVLKDPAISLVERFETRHGDIQDRMTASDYSAIRRLIETSDALSGEIYLLVLKNGVSMAEPTTNNSLEFALLMDGARQIYGGEGLSTDYQAIDADDRIGRYAEAIRKRLAASGGTGLSARQITELIDSIDSPAREAQATEDEPTYAGFELKAEDDYDSGVEEPRRQGGFELVKESDDRKP